MLVRIDRSCTTGLATSGLLLILDLSRAGGRAEGPGFLSPGQRPGLGGRLFSSYREVPPDVLPGRAGATFVPPPWAGAPPSSKSSEARRLWPFESPPPSLPPAP